MRPGRPPGARAAPSAPVPLGDEPSGSLTGHILAQGRPDAPAFDTGGRRWVVGILVAIAVLVAGGLTAAVLLLSGVR